MTTGLTSNSYLGDALHNNPNAYSCPTAGHLHSIAIISVAPLDAPSVDLNDWLIKRVAYDRKRRILELEMNTHERFQRSPARGRTGRPPAKPGGAPSAVEVRSPCRRRAAIRAAQRLSIQDFLW